MKVALLPILIAATFCGSSVAADSTNDTKSKQTLANEIKGENPYFTDSERGWYWYEQLPEEEKEKFVEKLKNQQPEVVKSQQAKDPKDVPLSQAWFRENFQKYMDYAQDNPYDQEAIRTYLYLEKYLRDKALAFGMERQKAVLSEPFLDHTATRPLANFGSQSMNAQATENKDALLSELGKQSGLYYFYRSDDVFSAQQATLIAQLRDRFGFTVLPISMDGSAPHESLGEKFELNQNQAQVLGIQVLPATYLFNPKNKAIELVSQGVQSVTDLKDRIMLAALRGGIIDEQQYQLTKPVGLYLTPDGYVSYGIGMPDNAPETFKNLYSELQKNLNGENK